MGSGHRRLLTRRGLVDLLSGIGLFGLLSGLQRSVLRAAGDVLGLGGGNGVTVTGRLDRRGLGTVCVRLLGLLCRLQRGVLGGAGDLGGLLVGHSVAGGLDLLVGVARRGRLWCLVCHQTSISKGCGRWATWGCSGPA